MPIRFQCWQCAKALSIGTRKAGTRIQCPVCGAAQTVPCAPGTVLHPSSTDSGEFPAALDGAEEDYPVAAPATPAAAADVTPACPPLPLQEPVALAPERHRLPQFLAGSLVCVLVAILGVAVWALISSAVSVNHNRILPPAQAEQGAARPGDQVQAANKPKLPVFDLTKPIPPVEKPAPLPKPEKQPPSPDGKPAQPPAVEKQPAAKLPEVPPAEIKPKPQAPEVQPKPQDKVPAPEIAKEKAPEPLRKLKIKRRSTLTAEDLRKQLLLASEVALDAPHAPQSSSWILKAARATPDSAGVDLAPQLMLRRPDLYGLPISMGLVCRLGKEPAETLQALSRKLRVHLEASIAGAAGGTVLDPRPDPDKLRARLVGDADRNGWLRPEAIPTLLQLLMAENRDVRRILVEVLAQIKGREASFALAQRALFDLDPDVREAAVGALQERPRHEYEAVLLAGFQYPWAAVADHAAEAVVALEMRDCAPKLVPLLDGKDVSRPFTVEVNKQRVTVVQELVRVNHLGNCLMCHAPSQQRTDLVRGRVPIPGEPLPAPVTTPKYYEGDRGVFVRADVTYLKQDFSVHQPVLNAGTWPNHQRYDYLVRRRPLSRPEVALWHKEARKLNPISPRKEALMFALRELTRKDPGPRVQDWKRLYDPISGDALAKPLSPEQLVGQLRRGIVDASPARQEAMLEAYKDRDGPAYDTALAQAICELSPKLQTKARGVLVERLTWVPLTELRERVLDRDAEIRRAALLACAAKDLPALAEDVRARLKDSDPNVAQAAIEALCRLDASYIPDSEVKRLRTTLVNAEPDAQEQLLETYGGGKGRLYDLVVAKAIPDLPTSLHKKARGILVERLVASPLKELREKLRDKDRETRYAAVVASRKKQVKSLVPDLIPCLGDEDSTIVWHTRAALRVLTGQDIGPSPTATPAEREAIIEFWQGWWKKQSSK